LYNDKACRTSGRYFKKDVQKLPNKSYVLIRRKKTSRALKDEYEPPEYAPNPDYMPDMFEDRPSPFDYESDAYVPVKKKASRKAPLQVFNRTRSQARLRSGKNF
jgi:hypothetical protein